MFQSYNLSLIPKTLMVKGNNSSQLSFELHTHIVWHGHDELNVCMCVCVYVSVCGKFIHKIYKCNKKFK